MYFSPTTYAYRPVPAADVVHPVVVVGAGPVGLTVALGLARQGHSVVVLEADYSACMGSRAICVSRHSLEVFQRLGIGQDVASAGVAWSSGRSFYRSDEVLAFQMPLSDGDVFPPMVNVSQSALEQRLIDQLLEVDGVEIYWGNRVVGCRQTDGVVTIEVETPDGRAEVLASWVVAADGARSAVREALGLRLHGTSYEGRYIIADIHWPTSLDTERRVWFDPPSAPGSTLILHRQPDDIWRIDYQLGVDDDPDEELLEPRIRDRITRHLEWLGDRTPWELEWATIYRAHSLSLDSYRSERVLFAGDAAHLVPIFGVRGLNSGLEDAESLAWMLAAVSDGRASDSLLNAWALERRDAWQQNIAKADLSTRFMTPGTDGYRLTRDAVLELCSQRDDLRALVNPRQSSATHARRSELTWATDLDPEANGVRPGDPLTDIPLAAPGGECAGTSLFALTGSAFTLIDAGLSEADRSAVDRRLARIVVDGDVVTVPLEWLDPQAAHAVLGTTARSVLVRPDGTILGVIDHDIVSSGQSEALAAETPEPPASEGSAVSAIEDAWTQVSEAIDVLEAEDRERGLARLALCLALEVGSASRLRSAIALAVDEVVPE